MTFQPAWVAATRAGFRERLSTGGRLSYLVFSGAGASWLRLGSFRHLAGITVHHAVARAAARRARRGSEAQEPGVFRRA